LPLRASIQRTSLSGHSAIEKVILEEMDQPLAATMHAAIEGIIRYEP